MQFEPLEKFTTAQYGVFWQRVRDKYPTTEERQPLSEVFETPSGAKTREPHVEVFEVPPLRRVFYISERGNFLLQVQPSRFLSNWRRIDEHDDYPRFSAARERFIAGWRTLTEYLAEQQIGVPSANQYELTYINHIFSDDLPAQWSKFLRATPWPDSREFLPVPSTGAYQLGFRLPNDKGMLRVSATHGLREKDKRQVLVLDFTARGPAKSDVSDLDEWFDVAHEWIVRGFADLTSREAHEKWERTA